MYTIYHFCLLDYPHPSLLSIEQAGRLYRFFCPPPSHPTTPLSHLLHFHLTWSTYFYRSP